MTDLIDAHVAHCRAAGLSPNTIRDRRKLLARLDTELPHGLEAATGEEYEQWLAAGREAGWSAETLATYTLHIRSWGRWTVAGRKPHLSFNPTAELVQPRRPKGIPHPISEEHLHTALTWCWARFQLPLRLAAFAGLRVGEIATVSPRKARGRGPEIHRGSSAPLPTHP
jgi:site-specific recombinase XerC